MNDGGREVSSQKVGLYTSCQCEQTFQSFINRVNSKFLLSGTAIGKTTIAKALCHELGADYYVINGSDEGRFLDTVRNQAKNF